jgi:hypothetical protein
MVSDGSSAFKKVPRVALGANENDVWLSGRRLVSHDIFSPLQEGG